MLELLEDIFITTPYVIYNLYITKKFYKVEICGGSPMDIFTKYTKNKNCIAWKCSGWMGNWEFTFVYRK